MGWFSFGGKLGEETASAGDYTAKKMKSLGYIFVAGNMGLATVSLA